MSEQIGIIDGRSDVDRPVVIPAEVFKIGYLACSLYLFYAYCQVNKQPYSDMEAQLRLHITPDQLDDLKDELVSKGLLLAKV